MRRKTFVRQGPWLLVVAMILMVPAPRADAGDPGRPVEPALAKLVAGLDSREHGMRQQATRELVRGGIPAVDALVEAAREGSLESNVRAVTILQEMYLHGDPETAEAAERALEQLSESPNRSVAGRAAFILSAHFEVREQRAVAAIERLGGHVEYAAAPRGGGVLNLADPTRVPREIQLVRLGSNWKGGDEGLRHLERLQSWGPFPMLYVIDGCDVSEEGLQALQAGVPQLVVQHRGRAFLGIRGGTDLNGPGCRVADVEEGSAAQKAGMQSEDVITRFKDRDVPDFETLIDLIATTKPGDKIKVEVRRGIDRVTLDVEMAGWR